MACTRVGSSTHEHTVASCLRAAHACAEGSIGVVPDLREASRLFERACELAPEACVSFREYLRGQCQLETAAACLRLAQLYRNGLGGPRDVERAASLAEKACKYGDPAGCQAASSWHAP